MKEILLCGSFGFGNVGDEAIYEAFYDLLKELNDPAGLHVLSRFPSPQVQFYGRPLCLQGDRKMLDDKLSRVPILVVGGGVFEPRSNAVAFKCFGEIARPSRQSHFLACSVEQGEYGFFQRRSIRKEIRKAETFCVRDQWSARQLKEIWKAPVACVGDLVLSMRRKQVCEDQNNAVDRYIVVSLCPQWSEPEWFYWLASELPNLAKELDSKVVFLPMAAANDGDVSVAESLSTIMLQEYDFDNIEVLREQLSPRDAFDVISNATLVVGMRLHSCVMACAAGVPCIPIAYHPKIMGFAVTMGIERLTVPQFGFEERRRLGEWKFDRSVFVPGLLGRLAQTAFQIRVDVDEYRELQRESVRILLERTAGYQKP